MTIAKALQRYGMILGDTGGALSLYAVGSQSWATDPYPGLLDDDLYTYLANIPVDRFRVLETGPQKRVTPLALRPSPCGRIDDATLPPVEIPPVDPPVDETPPEETPPDETPPEEWPPEETPPEESPIAMPPDEAPEPSSLLP
jgi:hypothetical protein